MCRTEIAICKWNPLYPWLTTRVTPWFFESALPHLGLIIKGQFQVYSCPLSCWAGGILLLRNSFSMDITKRSAIKIDVTYALHVYYKKAYINGNTFPIRTFFVPSFIRMHLIVFYFCVWKAHCVKINIFKIFWLISVLWGYKSWCFISLWVS